MVVSLKLTATLRWFSGKLVLNLGGIEKEREEGWTCTNMVRWGDVSQRQWERLFLDRFAYFFFLFVWKLSKNCCHRFFYSSPANSGDETKSRYAVKHLFLYVSKYFGRLTFELWNSVATFCRQTQDHVVETKKPDIFDTVIEHVELDITGKWVFWRGLWPFRVC